MDILINYEFFQLFFLPPLEKTNSKSTWSRFWITLFMKLVILIYYFGHSPVSIQDVRTKGQEIFIYFLMKRLYLKKNQHENLFGNTRSSHTKGMLHLYYILMFLLWRSKLLEMFWILLQNYWNSINGNNMNIHKRTER